MGMVLLPVAVEAAGGQPQGVWYVQTAWGIGGVDLIYPINRGLYFYDLTTGENGMALNPDCNFQGISPDLTLAACIASSYQDKPVKADLVLVGEVGLSGELRWVSQMPVRLREAAKLGFKGAVIPHRRNQNEKLPDGIKLFEARSLREALGYALLNSK